MNEYVAFSATNQNENKHLPNSLVTNLWPVSTIGIRALTAFMINSEPEVQN